MVVYFQQTVSKLFLLSDPMFLSKIPQACGMRLQRLDQILNYLEISPSQKQHDGFTQTVNHTGIVIQPCPLEAGMFSVAEWLYDIKINIWTESDNEKVQVRLGSKTNNFEINLVKLENGGLIFITDKSYFTGLLRCKNYQKGCLVRMKNRKQLEKHNAKCKTLHEVS